MLDENKTLSIGDTAAARTDPTVDLSKIGTVGCDRTKKRRDGNVTVTVCFYDGIAFLLRWWHDRCEDKPMVIRHWQTQ